MGMVPGAKEKRRCDEFAALEAERQALQTALAIENFEAFQAKQAEVRDLESTLGALEVAPGQQ